MNKQRSADVDLCATDQVNVSFLPSGCGAPEDLGSTPVPDFHFPDSSVKKMRKLKRRPPELLLLKNPEIFRTISIFC